MWQNSTTENCDKTQCVTKLKKIKLSQYTKNSSVIQNEKTTKFNFLDVTIFKIQMGTKHQI